MTFYYSQDGAVICYSHEREAVENWEGDIYTAPFKVRDFDCDAAQRALDLFKVTMRGVFGQSLAFECVV